MTITSFQDPRLERAVLGRKRFRVKGVPYKESVEYKIYMLKKELGKKETSLQYQFLFFGEWKQITVDEYLKYQEMNLTVRVI